MPPRHHRHWYPTALIMKARIYYRLNIALLDLGLGDAFVPGEEALLEAITQLYTRELLELRTQIMNLFPDALLEREKLFRSEPMYLSLTLITSLEKHQVEPALDQMRKNGQLAAWEDTDQEKYPSIRWLLDQQPRTKTLPREVQGNVSLHTIGPLFHYHLRIFPEEISTLRLQGINATTGQSFVSEMENHDVLVLNFALDLGDSFLLWIYQGNTVVARAMVRQMGHLIVESEEGVHIRHLGRDTVSGGFSTSP